MNILRRAFSHSRNQSGVIVIIYVVVSSSRTPHVLETRTIQGVGRYGSYGVQCENYCEAMNLCCTTVAVSSTLCVDYRGFLVRMIYNIEGIGPLRSCVRSGKRRDVLHTTKDEDEIIFVSD